MKTPTLFFLKSNIDITIQLQVLSMRGLPGTSIIYITMKKQKAPINKSSHNKTPKNKLRVSRIWKTSNFLSCHRLRWYVSARKNFAYLSSFAKVSIPIKIYNWLTYLDFQTIINYFFEVTNFFHVLTRLLSVNVVISCFWSQ